MNSIEDDLKRALRRQEPPGDLAAKIMNRVVSGENLEPERHPRTNKVLGFRLKPKLMVWLATAAAAACLLGLFVTRSYQSDRTRIPTSGSGPATASRTEVGDGQPKSNDNPAPASIVASDKSGSTPQLAGGHAGQRRSKHLRTESYHRGAGNPTSAEARFAEEQLKLALEITSAKLGYAQRSIQEADGARAPEREINP